MSSSDLPKAGLLNIGEEAKPPFAVLPDPVAVFHGRAKRLETLAKGHALEGYLTLVARICKAQSEVAQAMVEIPPATQMPALSTGLPPFQRDNVALGAAAEETLTRLCVALTDTTAPEAFQAARTAIEKMTEAGRLGLLAAALKDPVSEDTLARHILAGAALQVHFSRLAATLPAAEIAPVADGVCPVCGSPPVASAVVSWPAANNTRFCTCSLCATQWHVVRVKCVMCSSTGGLSYPHIEGHTDSLRAETCGNCKRYVKIVYQIKDPACEPFADDTASLDLDLVLKAEGWARGGKNPFLQGY